MSPARIVLLRITYGLLGLVLIVGGFSNYFVYRSNAAPVEMSLEQYLKQPPPTADWVRLTGCQVDYPASVCLQNERTISEISTPVYPAGFAKGSVQVVSVIARPSDFDPRTFPKQTRIETVEGLIRSGILNHGLDPKLRNRARWQLDPSYILIDQGKRPSLLTAVILLIVGALLVVCATWRPTGVDASACPASKMTSIATVSQSDSILIY